MSGRGGDLGKPTNAEWSDLIAVTERQIGELQRVGGVSAQRGRGFGDERLRGVR
jgi:hypothetical protein